MTYVNAIGQLNLTLFRSHSVAVVLVCSRPTYRDVLKQLTTASLID